MADLTPLQRRAELHRLLSARKRVVASELAKDWACNERTVRRTLEKMRDEQRLPIEFDPIEQTWRYTAKVEEIPAAFVSAADRRALLFSLQAASQLDGTPVCRQVKRLYETLLATLPPERVTRHERMMKSVRFTSPPAPSIKPEVWDVLLLCLEAGETMHITYTDGGYGSSTYREVDPYGLITRDHRWILVAYCHYMKGVRHFSLHRITSAAGTDKEFHVPDDFMDRHMIDAFDGLQSTAEMKTVILRIAKDAPPYIRDRVWSDGEQRRQDEQGRIVVEFPAAAMFVVEREVRAEGGWVEVMQPAALRAKIRRAGEMLAKGHS